jgi:DnaK suppressor protein
MAMTTDEHNTPALDGVRLAVLRARLEVERERLRRNLQELDAEVREEEPPPDEPEDLGEMGRDLTEERIDRALIADQHRLLAQVGRALQRMDEGTYGLSEISGRPPPSTTQQSLDPLHRNREAMYVEALAHQRT